MNMIRRRVAARLFAFSVLVVVPASTSVSVAADAVTPSLSCAGASYPAFPALDTPPNVRFWTGASLDEGWNPSACTERQATPTTSVAVAGHFTGESNVDAMLTRIGAISALHDVRYWSVTEKRWNNLFIRSMSLSAPDPKATRGDFSSAEFHKGGELYFLSVDNRVSNDIVTRLRVMDVGPQSIALEMTDISPMRWFAFSR